MLEIRRSSLRAFWDGKPVKLTVSEINMIDALTKDDAVHSRESIMMWIRRSRTDNVRNVDTIIKRIRKKVPGAIIETVYGAGYRGIPANITWRD